MEKECDLFILESEWLKHCKRAGVTGFAYLKQRQEYDNLNYRMKKGYNSKILHPLPKDK